MKPPSLPYSEACERNQEPILMALQRWLRAAGTVLEIGAGTGQHAVHFASHLHHVTWQPTDRAEHLWAIGARVQQAALTNLSVPLELDVRSEIWPVERVRYVFSANTTHIMSWPEVEAMFAGIVRVLEPAGVLVLYGPFNRNGDFTSESNRMFDQHLRSRDPAMGIRDDEALIRLGRRGGLALTAEYDLPANNRVLVWTCD